MRRAGPDAGSTLSIHRNDGALLVVPIAGLTYAEIALLVAGFTAGHTFALVWYLRAPARANGHHGPEPLTYPEEP